MPLCGIVGTCRWRRASGIAHDPALLQDVFELCGGRVGLEEFGCNVNGTGIFEDENARCG